MIELVTHVSLLVVMMIVRLVVSCFYKRTVTDARPQWQGCPPQHLLQQTGVGDTKFKHDAFSCFDNCNYCMFGCFCTPCRIADTYTAAGVGPGCGPSFWTFVIVVELLAWPSVIGALASSPVQKQLLQALQLPFGIAFAIWMTTRRRELRKALGDSNPQSNAGLDCLLWYCCGCCVTIQEARQVDEATGTEVACCLRLKHLPQQSVVGLPVLAAPLAPQEPQHVALAPVVHVAAPVAAPVVHVAAPVVAPQELQPIN